MKSNSKASNDDKNIRELPIDAICYQSLNLIAELKTFLPDKYSDEACQIACLIFCVVKHISSELETISKNIPVQADEELRAKDLADIIQTLYSLIRYIKSSTPEQSPPGIQIAVDELAKEYFPKENGNPLCLVRPKWEYNWECVFITQILKSNLRISTLDPNDKLSLSGGEDFLLKVWDNYSKEWINDLKSLNLQLKRKPFECDDSGEKLREIPPNQLAIISFAKLDTFDSLMYPILAHELGHFIDNSSDPTKSESIKNDFEISQAEVEQIYKTWGYPKSPTQIVGIWKDINDKINTALGEVLADLLAIRMMGISYYISLTEYLKTLSDLFNPIIGESGHPGAALRIMVSYQELIRDEDGKSIFKFLESHRGSCEKTVTWIKNYLDNWKVYIEELNQTKPSKFSAEDELKILAVTKLKDNIGKIIELAGQIIPSSNKFRLSPVFFYRISQLKSEIPPFLEQKTSKEFSEILSAAWVYQLMEGDTIEKGKKLIDDGFQEYKKTCRLVLKSIELIPSRQHLLIDDTQKITNKTEKVVDENRGVCSGPNILKRMTAHIEDEKYLGIIPIIKNKVDPSSLDLHLGNWFAVSRKTQLSHIDMSGSPEEYIKLLELGRDEIYVGFEHSFVIHPGDFVLSTTLEFVKLPNDLMAFVEGKSKIGRLGLFIATATKVDPGFHGVIVLELANTGTLPLAIKPGIPIAQLVFQKLDEAVIKESMKRGTYHCQIKPLN